MATDASGLREARTTGVAVIASHRPRCRASSASSAAAPCSSGAPCPGPVRKPAVARVESLGRRRLAVLGWAGGGEEVGEQLCDALSLVVVDPMRGVGQALDAVEVGHVVAVGLGGWKKKDQTFRSWLGLRSPCWSRRGWAVLRMASRSTTSGSLIAVAQATVPAPVMADQQRRLGTELWDETADVGGQPVDRVGLDVGRRRRPAAMTGCSRAGRARRLESRPPRAARSAAAS
jgi:hypothetical protein